MSEVNKNLGHATAYGYAKSKGYSGTEEQFAEVMADVANVAQRAEDAADVAVAAKGAAETAAANAEQGATNAGNYAGSAETAKYDAQEAKTAAEASASAAAQSATQASGSATQAAQKATEAYESATQAAQFAISAQTAKMGAETARTEAETAQQNAETAEANAEQSATTAEWYASRVERFLPTDTASGAIASFVDGADGVPMRDLTVSMSPVQDLHGQDAPYPAGGGANKFDEQMELGVIDSSTGNNSGSTTQLRSINYIPVIPETSYYALTQGNTAIIRFYDADKVYLGSEASTVASNSVFTAPANAYYMRFYLNASYGTTYNHDIAINYPSSVTTYAPYSNICPISGWDEGTVWGTGRNIFDPTKYVAGSTVNPVSLNGDTYTMTWVNGGVSFRTKGVQTFPAGTYAISAIGSNADSVRFFAYDAETDALIASISSVSTFTASVPFYIGVGGDHRNPGTAVFTIQLETGSTASPYSPYTGASYHSDFPSTVYGGDWAVTEGEIADKMAQSVLTSSNIASVEVSSGGVCYALCGIPTGCKSDGYIIADRYAFSTNASTNNSIRLIGTTICIYDNRFTDLETARAVIGEVQICYELATPITHSIDSYTIPTNYGDNNVWSDAGDVSVTYRADVGLYIDKKLEA